MLCPAKMLGTIMPSASITRLHCRFQVVRDLFSRGFRLEKQKGPAGFPAGPFKPNSFAKSYCCVCCCAGCWFCFAMSTFTGSAEMLLDPGF